MEIKGQETDSRGDFFRCPCCGKESFHPEDRKQGYCGACHWWTGDSTLGADGTFCQTHPEHTLVQVRLEQLQRKPPHRS